MATRNDSPTVPTFSQAHKMSRYRKLSSSTSTLACIAEQPHTQTIHRQKTYLHSPSAQSPKTTKWKRYNTHPYNHSVVSQHVYHDVQISPTLPTGKCPSSLVFPLLSPKSNHKTECDNWNQGWDAASVQEIPYVADNYMLPLIMDNDFEYYPEQSAKLASAWGDSSGENEFEVEVIKVADRSESFEIIETKMVTRIYDRRGFKPWFKKMLRKLKGRE